MKLSLLVNIMSRPITNFLGVVKPTLYFLGFNEMVKERGEFIGEPHYMLESEVEEEIEANWVYKEDRWELFKAFLKTF